MFMKANKTFLSLIWILLGSIFLNAQDTPKAGPDEIYKGLEFRGLGPALTSGRIADLAIHPEDESILYVAVGSGGIWKTVNAGTTWSPIFDSQASYSIGCITLDPSNPNTVWAGTGENVGGRHVGFGDGIYVSHDAGATWKNTGLKNSEHISKIIVHPEDANVIWVAVQGPLWNKGGERGLYKSTDGGITWNKTLGNEEWTGVTDIVLDPENPDVLYAATWDRHRTVAAYMGGGPGSGVHRSDDGGNTWVKLSEGIPTSNLGKIGLAISPFNHETIYAAIELDRKKGGIYMSTNKGVSWTKQSETVSGGTGPHYYQELYASPHQEGRLYLMSFMVLISDDHGKTFRSMNEENKHVDSHAMLFKESDPDYLLFGTDGGLYESHDLAKTWRFFGNLPVTQYYKIAVDDTSPFYNIYGGTQDNGSHGGPSRTKSKAGILNSDWWITLGADGHQSAIEPGNPDITYGEFQQGWLWRVDQTTGETVFIQPQPAKGDPFERFNWDAPILVSPHKSSRLYFASYRVWKSEDRGDDWIPVSGDLTRNEERIGMPIMGRKQSWDNAWDVAAMSDYNTITSLAESPLKEGLIYAGTDDGTLQITEDGGSNWRKVMLGSIKGIPARAFVNDVRADLFDANTVYLVLDNHKEGDFKPYFLKSTDTGKTWTMISGDLPQRLLGWRIVQDHIKKELLFAATEFGIYFTSNGGSNWIKLGSGLPTISFRDITIQRRENDLVAGSFGRGIFILDDITPLREFSTATRKDSILLFPVRPAYQYIEKDEVYGQGDNQYAAKNSPFGATFTYYLPEKLKSHKEMRQEKEKTLNKEKSDIPFPGWDILQEEKNNEGPSLSLVIKDAQGEVVNTVPGSNLKGFNRVSWPLNFAKREGVSLIPPIDTETEEDFFSNAYLAGPGTYSVTLYEKEGGELTLKAGPMSFEVKTLGGGALPAKPASEIVAFRLEYQQFSQDLGATDMVLSKSLEKVRAMKRALDEAKKPTAGLHDRIYKAEQQLLAIDETMNGNAAKNEIGEDSKPSPQDADFVGMVALNSTYGPTAGHRKAFERARTQLSELKTELRKVSDTSIPALEKELQAAGAPWIEGQGLID